MGALAMSETTAGSDVVAMKIKADKKGIDFQQFCFHPLRTPTSFTLFPPPILLQPPILTGSQVPDPLHKHAR